MHPKMMHGKLIIKRYLIMEFVKLYAVWDVLNTCRYLCNLNEMETLLYESLDFFFFLFKLSHFFV